MQFIQLELCIYTMTINRCNKIESQMKFLTQMSLIYIKQKTTVAVFSLYCFCYILCHTYWSLILKLNTRTFNFLSIGNSFASELIELINIVQQTTWNGWVADSGVDVDYYQGATWLCQWKTDCDQTQGRPRMDQQRSKNVWWMDERIICEWT